jgi:HAD superfamily hydrolase (TIGR01509 family)
MQAAVIFDCDGVLVDSERINSEVMAEMLTRAGLPTTFEESVERYLGLTTRECIEEAEARLGRSLDFDLGREYEQCVLDRQRRELVVIPGVHDLLRKLREASFPVCIASSATPYELQVRLAITHLDEHFEGQCHSAETVQRGKPAPDVFLRAAERIGVSPERCLLVEDSPRGIQGGKAAGMTVVGFAGLVTADRLREAGADHVVSEIAEVYEIALGVRCFQETNLHG